MTESDWGRFAELLQEVVSMGGPWQEKAQLVIDKIDTYGRGSDLPEFLSWFDDDGEVAK